MSSGNSPFEQEIQPQVRPEPIRRLKSSGVEDRVIKEIIEKNAVKTKTLEHYDAKTGTKRDASGEEKH